MESSAYFVYHPWPHSSNRSTPGIMPFVTPDLSAANDAIARFPAPARTQAIDRLNRGQGRSIIQTLFPGREEPS